MSKIIVLFNPLAGNGTCAASSKRLETVYAGEEIEFVDIVSLGDKIEGYIKTLPSEDKIILCGGDGTINHFINAVNTKALTKDIYYYPSGSGNDFYNDVKPNETEEVFNISKYICNLPTVKVKDIKKKFINGIGYGIDGYCCEEGDKVRQKKSGKPVNYSIIALKGLLYDFNRVNAKVTVDGVCHEYKDVWMAPAMNGRFYGGGMMCAPNQDRLNDRNQVSVIVVHTSSRLKLLMAFTSVYKGEHLKYTKLVTELKGSSVHVEYDRPTALQIDGDTVIGVTEYTVTCD